ncbi:ead/Ea22-like family protein [Enterobacter hormaechei]|uniref:ead/Ea22-like family protein n=1 Tax=Enterobacter hormaechei TaxID=158836 RepID=UPI0035A57930
MSTIDKRALREVAEKATKGEWWSDVVETDGEYGEGEDRVSGYHSYAVYFGHESLLDMANSTAAYVMKTNYAGSYGHSRCNMILPRVACFQNSDPLRRV